MQTLSIEVWNLTIVVNSTVVVGAGVAPSLRLQEKKGGSGSSGLLYYQTFANALEFVIDQSASRKCL